MRRIFYDLILLVGLFGGVLAGLYLFSLFVRAVLKSLEILFPQYVIERPIDYAGPLPYVSLLIALLITAPVFLIALVKYSKRYAAFFRLIYRNLRNGKIGRLTTQVLLAGSIAGFYVGGFVLPMAGLIVILWGDPIR
jgi:hypothetical protein